MMGEKEEKKSVGFVLAELPGTFWFGLGNGDRSGGASSTETHTAARLRV